MAITEYGVNAPEAQKLWSKMLAHEVKKACYISKFVGTSEDSLIQEKTDAKKAAGDRITNTLVGQMTGAGILGDSRLKGNLESLTSFTDNLLIDQLRHGADASGRMSKQRVPWNIREACMTKLRDWWAVRMDRAAFIHLAGSTYTQVTGDAGETYDCSDLRYTGNNSPIAPESTAHYRYDATNGLTSAASDEDLGSTDTMTLTVLDDLKAEAELRSTLIRPINYQGEKMYVVFLHTLQARDLRTNTSTGQWQDIQKAAMQGGDIKKNPIFTGSLGVYNNMILHSTSRIPYGQHSSTGAAIATTRRGVLCGAQAMTLAFGKGYGWEKVGWVEELDDFENNLEIGSNCIFGMKKNIFNSLDFGTLVLSTYAA